MNNLQKEKKNKAASNPPPPYTLWELLQYFLWLGTFGFGGPIALIGYMQKDLVEHKQWISKSDYLEGLGLSQLCPGPLAAQLAMYLGWIRSGVLGATLVGLAFILPSFLMVLTLAIMYVHFGSLPWMQGVFYGIGASVVAIILRSSLKLAKMTIEKYLFLIGFFLLNVGVTIWLAAEIVWVFIASGLAYMLIKAPPKLPRINPSFAFLPEWLTTGIHGAASVPTLGKILIYFAWAGTFVFGSGLAIVPFLHNGVVNKLQWLNEQQFMDAVAVALITPGTVVITVAFIGYLAGGFLGAFLAAMGVFIPPYAFVIGLATHYRKIVSNLSIQAFVKGITAAIAGAITGAAFILGKSSIYDVSTICIFLVSCLILFFIKKISDPLLIIVAGLVGYFLKN